MQTSIRRSMNIKLFMVSDTVDTIVDRGLGFLIYSIESIQVQLLLVVITSQIWVHIAKKRSCSSLYDMREKLEGGCLLPTQFIARASL